MRGVNRNIKIYIKRCVCILIAVRGIIIGIRLVTANGVGQENGSTRLWHMYIIRYTYVYGRRI